MHFRPIGNRVQVLESLHEQGGCRKRVVASLEMNAPVPADVLAQLTETERATLEALLLQMQVNRRRERLMRQLGRSEDVLEDIREALSDPDLVKALDSLYLSRLGDWCDQMSARLADIRSRPTRMSQPVVLDPTDPEVAAMGDKH